MTALLVPVNNTGQLGGLQMRSFAQKFMALGLVVSLAVHATVLATYALVTLLLNSGGGESGRIYYFDTFNPGPPPSLSDAKIPTLIKPALPQPKAPILAVPKPVPDKLAPVENPIPNQDQLDKIYNQIADSLGDIRAGDSIVVLKDIPGEEPIPDSRIYIPREQEPLLIKRVAPLYPEIARKAAVGGRVLVKFWVDKKGEVKKPEVVKVEPAGLGFEEAAIEAVSQWKFTPALQQDKPVGVWVVQAIKFEVK